MGRVKVISFDLDGTLFDSRFVDSVWLEEIPRLYSVKKRVSVDEARREVKREYDKVGNERVEWYNLNYWINKFNLDVDGKQLLRSCEHKIKPYPEARNVLERLKQKGFRLVVVTNARREFAELELEKAEMKECFERVFSSTSDFGVVKKAATLYQRVCKILGISPQEMVHVGDDQDFDFDAPRRIGIRAFHLDRSGSQKGEFAIHSLEEFAEKLQRLGE